MRGQIGEGQAGESGEDNEEERSVTHRIGGEREGGHDVGERWVLMLGESSVSWVDGGWWEEGRKRRSQLVLKTGDRRQADASFAARTRNSLCLFPFFSSTES